MDRPTPKPQVGGKQQQLSLQQALATTLTVTSPLSQTQCTPSSPQLLGMMMLPARTTGQVKASSGITTVHPLASPVTEASSCSLPVILQSPHSTAELNFIVTPPASQPQQTPLLLSTSRGTVHHMGIGGLMGEGSASKLHVLQSPVKELSFAHLKNQLQQAAKNKRPRADSGGGGVTGQKVYNVVSSFESPGSSVDEVAGEMPPMKKIKVEVESSSDNEVTFYRKLYCADREKELEKKNYNYKSMVMELFFLEEGKHLMDYFGWQKRSQTNGPLMRYLCSRRAEDLGEYGGQEKSINNEVKVLTTSGGTHPIVTPVAISKTLPPAITAMQQQQQQENGGIPLSTTAATTTVGSPPPYTAECTSSTTVVTIVAVTTTTVTMTSALPKTQLTEGFSQPSIDIAGCRVADIYQPSLTTVNHLPDSQNGIDKHLPVVPELQLLENTSVTPAVSEEAVVELAKQEAQVMQRIAELRKQGLWSLKQLPKVQEPVRHKSHWDYLLEEMQWMAVDFTQERHWKISCAKHVSMSLVNQQGKWQQKQILRQTKEEQNRKTVAKTVSEIVKAFWSGMTEMALFKRHQVVEVKNRRLLNYVASDITMEALHSTEASEQQLSSGDNLCTSNEIADLIMEGEMPLDELVQKYEGAYSKDFEDEFLCLKTDSPESNCSSWKNASSEGEDADVEDMDNAEATSSILKDHSDPVEKMIRTALGLQPDGYSCDSEMLDKHKSSLMKLKLWEYQLVGVKWISSMYQQSIGCVLSDEEGLGKKMQTITFLSNLAVDMGNWGPHLIVVPSGSLFTWQIIFTRWCPALKIFVYYGNYEERMIQRLNWTSYDCENHHVFVTSYKFLIEDASYFEGQTWNCLILDEADKISSDMLLPLLSLSSEHHLLLTNVSLSSFPLKQLFATVMLTFASKLRRDFKERFSYLLPNNLPPKYGTKEYDDLSKILHEIKSVISLRRLKQDVSTQLPKFEMTNVLCPLTIRQQKLYEQLTTSDSIRDVFVTGHMLDILSLLVKLKRLCNHPALIEEPGPVTSALQMDGLVLPLPSLLESHMQESSLKTDAWSAMTGFIDMEMNSSGRQLVSRQQPLIEELNGNSTADGITVDLEVNVRTAGDKSGKLVIRGAEGHAGSTTLQQETSTAKSSVIKKDHPGMSVLDEEKPLYGTGLQNLLTSMTSELAQKDVEHDHWRCEGFVRCSLGNRSNMLQSSQLETTDSFNNLLNFSTDFEKLLNDKLATRVSVCPGQIAVPPVKVVTPKKVLVVDELADKHSADLDFVRRALHTENKMSLKDQLIMTDSGKLQLLDLLMKHLIAEKRRVVILSYMMPMLDMLEIYLDRYKLLYLRIDDNTKVEKHHLIVQRFNDDSKVFCLLMSSRTSFVGGFEWPNADAVVLFDGDLSPTMSRRAERTLHAMAEMHSLCIFRFITKNTIEESLASDTNNLLQRGILTDSGPVYERETLRQLFKTVPLVEEIPDANLSDETDVGVSVIPEDILEANVNLVDGKEDIASAVFLQNLKDYNATNSNSDEQMGLEQQKTVSGGEEGSSDVKLSEIEKYAVSFVERHADLLVKDINRDEEGLEELLKTAKPLAHKRKLIEEWREEDDMELEEEEKEENTLMFTYPMDRENKQVFVSDVTGEQMPIWMPPTPPHDDSDVYVDHTLLFLYEPSVMSESQLPPVYVKKGHKRMKLEGTTTRRVKVQREDQQLPPRSLFERPQAILRSERDQRQLKHGQMKAMKLPVQVPIRPTPEPPSDQPDWLIHEDWTLLQAFQLHQDLPIGTSSSISSAHIANWELVADLVNSCSRTYRSPKQCKNRFENVILPREEGKFLYDINPRKLKKSTKGLYKTKNNQPMRTNQLYVQDNGRSLTNCFMMHFDAIRGIAAKRTNAPRSPPSSMTIRNTKHIQVLAECGIMYDQPLLPLHIATMRAERIAKDKKQAQTSVTGATSDQQAAMSSAVSTQLRLTPHQTPGTPMVIQTGQPTTQTVLQTGQQLVPGQHITATPAAVVSAPLSGQDGRQQQMTIVQASGQQLQAVASGSAGLLATSLQKVVGSTASIVTSVPLPRNLTMTGIVVTQAAGLNRPQTVVSSAALMNLPNPTVRTIRNVVPLTIRDSVAPAALTHSTINISAQDARSLGQVVATTGLTTTQLVVTQQKPAIGLSQLNAGAAIQHHMLKTQTTTIPGIQLQMRPQQRLSTAILQQARPVQLAVQNPMTALLRKQPQGKTLTGVVQNSLSVTPITVTRQQQQQLEGGALQQLQQQGTTSGTMSPAVTTLLKAVSNPAASLANVTIPVSAVSFGINVTHPKLLSGKTAGGSPQQIHQVQVPKRTPTAVQFSGPKVATLGQMTKTASPVILQQQQQKFVTPQARFHHVISSSLPSSSGTVIATQIIHQSNAQATLPASIAAAAVAPTSSKASVTVTLAGTGLSGVATIPMSSLCQVANPTSAAISTPAKVMPGQTALMYTKPGKETHLGLQKTAMVVPSGLQQVTVRPAVAQTLAGSPQLLQGAHITMAAAGNKAVPSLTPVEKAVQEVVQQAQAQARQVPPISFAPVSQGSQPQVVTAQHLLVTSVGPAPASSATLVQVSGSLSPATGEDPQQKSSPYAMKLRNQRS